MILFPGGCIHRENQKIKHIRIILSFCMRAGIPVILILTATLLTAGCFYLPGMHVLKDSPDPVAGHWVSGEPPATDLHILLFENRTYITHDFYLGQNEMITYGTWSRGDQEQIILQPAAGNITSWVYDPTIDTISPTGLPQRKYYRFKG